jgi:signal transduction histidine kinase
MSVQCRIDAALRAFVDARLLAEVFGNLLRNAAEACSGNGHVDIVATDIVATGAGGIAIEVVDDGPGVPTHLREEIFKPFRSSKEYGTGIGLAFCRKVVESHGGSIALVDRPGCGACFRIELPGGS